MCIFLFLEVLNPTGDSYKQLLKFPPNLSVLLSQFLCAWILHMSLQDELKQGMLFMKYAVNHPKFFRSPSVAFTSGLIQTLVVMLVEMANIIVILAAPDVIEVILNFIAIAIIADFDDFVFTVIKYDHNRKSLLESDDVDDNLLEIYHTTSRHAPFANNEKIEVPTIDNRVPDEKEIAKKARRNKNIVYVDLHMEKRLIRVNFWKDRDCCNKFMRMIYCILRLVYVALWFYFVPFLVLLMCYVVPRYYGDPVVLANTCDESPIDFE